MPLIDPEVEDLTPGQRAVLLECVADERYGSIQSAMFRHSQTRNYLERAAKSLVPLGLGTGYTRTTSKWGEHEHRVEWKFTLTQAGYNVARDARRRGRQALRDASRQQAEHARRAADA